MKVVGRRKDRPSTIGDAQALQKLAIGMRRMPWLMPRSGVHRFTSFEEAEQWNPVHLVSHSGKLP